MGPAARPDRRVWFLMRKPTSNRQVVTMPFFGLLNRLRDYNEPVMKPTQRLQRPHDMQPNIARSFLGVGPKGPTLAGIACSSTPRFKRSIFRIHSHDIRHSFDAWNSSSTRLQILRELFVSRLVETWGGEG